MIEFFLTVLKPDKNTILSQKSINLTKYSRKDVLTKYSRKDADTQRMKSENLCAFAPLREII